MMATHIGIVKVKIAVLPTPPSTSAQIKKPVKPAVWNNPRINNVFIYFVAMDLRKNIRIIYKAIALKKLHSVANVAGIDINNAFFIKE